MNSDIPPDERNAKRLDRIEYELQEIRATLGIIVEGMRAIGERVQAEDRIGELCEKAERIAARRKRPRVIR